MQKFNESLKNMRAIHIAHDHGKKIITKIGIYDEEGHIKETKSWELPDVLIMRNYNKNGDITFEKDIRIDKDKKEVVKHTMTKTYSDKGKILSSQLDLTSGYRNNVYYIYQDNGNMISKNTNEYDKNNNLISNQCTFHEYDSNNNKLIRKTTYESENNTNTIIEEEKYYYTYLPNGYYIKEHEYNGKIIDKSKFDNKERIVKVEAERVNLITDNHINYNIVEYQYSDDGKTIKDIYKVDDVIISESEIIYNDNGDRVYYSYKPRNGIGRYTSELFYDNDGVFLEERIDGIVVQSIIYESADSEFINKDNLPYGRSR